MGKDRLTAFSDGVIAIIITIMVLELKIPKGADAGVLLAIVPNLVAYVLSFIYLAIYWNNHHHLFHTVVRVDGLMLWANCNLLFWLSLMPAATAWLGDNFGAPLPTAIYGFVLLMPAIAYYLLQQSILRKRTEHALLAKALGSDLKGKASVGLYMLAAGLAFMWPWASIAIYLLVAIIWLVPDKRIERALSPSSGA